MKFFLLFTHSFFTVGDFFSCTFPRFVFQPKKMGKRRRGIRKFRMRVTFELCLSIFFVDLSHPLKSISCGICKSLFGVLGMRRINSCEVHQEVKRSLCEWKTFYETRFLSIQSYHKSFSEMISKNHRENG